MSTKSKEKCGGYIGLVFFDRASGWNAKQDWMVSWQIYEFIFMQ